MNIKFILIFLMGSLCYHVNAQINTEHIMPILNHASSARMAAHGGYGMSLISSDISQVLSNPAYFNGDSTIPFDLSHRFLWQGGGVSTALVGSKISKWNLAIHGGIQVVNHGGIDGYTERGETLGVINASEQLIVIGASKHLYDNLRLGANINMVISNLAGYSSSAIAVDLGGVYHIPGSLHHISLQVANLGSQLTTYGGIREPLPLNIQAAGSLRLQHIPVRFGVVAHHLQRWNLLYDNPYDLQNTSTFDDPFSEPKIKEYGFIDNVFRHLVLQSEIAMGKKEGFMIRLSYNHLLRRSMSVNNFRSLAGFAGGLGIKAGRFHFDYGLSVYHLAGSSHTLTLGTYIGKWKKRGL